MSAFFVFNFHLVTYTLTHDYQRNLILIKQLPLLSRIFMVLSILFLLFILWMVLLANTGQSSIFFDLVKRIPYGDKVGHLCLFGGLTFVSIVALKFRVITLFGLKLYLGAVLVSCFAIAEEGTQYFISTRTFDVIDLLADTCGIILFYSVAAVMDRRLQNHRIK